MSGSDRPRFGLSPEQFVRSHPFHLVIDAAGRIAQLGRSLARLCPDLVVGAPVPPTLVARRPRFALEPMALGDHAGRLVLLEHASGLQLRGAFLPVTDDTDGPPAMLYLGSAWMTTVEEMRARGLGFDDFALHDPVVDMVHLVRAQQITLDDLRESLSRLEGGRRDLRRERERAEAAEHRLLEAIESLEEGFVLFDSEDRLSLCNSRYRALYAASADLLVPGAKFEDLLREGARRGQYPDAVGRIDDWIAERMRAHRSASSVIEQRLPEGTWLRIAERRTASGGVVGFRVDITGFKEATARAEAAAQEAQRLSRELDAILDHSPDGYVAFDTKGRVSYANAAFYRMTEPARSVTGLGTDAFDALLAALHDPQQPLAPLARMPEGGCDRLHLVRPQPLVLQRSVIPMRDEAGARAGWFVHLRDVTREHETDRMKSQLLSHAAHELRTPIASIHGFSELLTMRDYDAATGRDIAETIHKQSSLLVALVNELLDLARIEARGARDFRMRVQPLLPLVRESCHGILVKGDARLVTLRVDGPVPDALVDAGKLQRVLTNVLSNAYKYSQGRGAIEVSFRVPADAGEVGVAVRDEGIGMTAEEVTRAFDRFYRADPSGTIPGSGLGLALVKEIIELMRGRVEILSEPGRGTTVILWLKTGDPSARP
jgi:signal transduction histidine kinase